ncbi:MAG: hypothetical protein R2710_04115 [Acidimicrobiales bacterium]
MDTTADAPDRTISSPPLRIGLMYDCRLDPRSDMTMSDVYAATIEQAVMADQFGLSHVLVHRASLL